MDGNGLVQIAFLHKDHVSYSWTDSMRRLIRHDTNGSRQLAKGGEPLNIRCSTGQLVPSRNYAVQLFLDKTPHEWLWFVDTDMGFLPDTVDRLLEAADPAHRPVVGALCFAQHYEGYDGMGGMRVRILPTMYRIGRESDSGYISFCYVGEYQRDTLTQVAATGMACILFHRSALEKVRAEHGDCWFDQIVADSGNLIGEDFSLCARMSRLDIPIHVHTGIGTTHHKEVWLAEDDYLDQVVVDNFQPVQMTHPDLLVAVDVPASLQSLAADEHVHDGMLKLPADLDRYRQIIEATRPEVIVETGTHTGASARWFAEQGLDVVTIDVDSATASGEHEGGLIEYTITRAQQDGHGDICWIKADTADPSTAAGVAAVVHGRRCMVSLDSDHSGPHVAKEIELYGPLVTPGCYLVVEDGLFGYAPEPLRAQHGLAEMVGSPLDAIAEHLQGNPDWSRDIAIERMSPVSHHPGGWWVRNA